MTIERRLLVERDPASETGWTGRWLVAVDGLLVQCTTTSIEPQGLVDAMDDVGIEAYEARRAAR